MDEYSQITEFGKVLIFLIIGIIFVCATIFLSRIISPNKPNPEKNSSYECGEEVNSNSWVQFNSRFYVIALVFLLFDVEMIFIFPWSTVFSSQEIIAIDNRWGWLTFIEMLIFIGILLLGLVYVWRKKDLIWIKPEYIAPKVDTKIPLEAYTAINQHTYITRSLDSENKQKEIEDARPINVSADKPKFVPRFKKSTP